jgi:hypothetical protein
MQKSDLESAVDFYKKTLDASQADRIAVGHDHIDWLINAATDVVPHLNEMERLIRYVAGTNYHTIPPEFHGLLDKLLDD